MSDNAAKTSDGSGSEGPDWVRIFDTTLRDGEQSPGCTMNVDEKVVVARQLEALRVDVIEAGFAAASPGDVEAVSRVAAAVQTPVVLSLSRTREGDIDRALAAVEHAHNPGIHIFIATSDLHMEQKLGMKPSEVLEAAAWAVERAAGHVDHIEFSAEDASRSRLEFLIEVFGEAIRAGATVCNVPDTTGYAIPQQTRELFAALRERTVGGRDIVWSAPCHNDLGLAVANSLAAVEGGARQVECTINGIGERAGNTSMEEVVMSLHTRADYYGVGSRIHTEQIYPASRTLASVIGVPVSPTKPIVGDNAFAHEAGIHQDGVLKNAQTYEIMRPETVGRVSNRIVLGKHSGRHAFAERLRELGIDLERIDVNEAFDLFKRLADKKKDIYDADLFAIVAKEWDSATHFELLDVRCDSSWQGSPTATVKVRVGDTEQDAEAVGDGMVDACYRAIKEATGQWPRLESYQVKGITGGTDAVGEVTCMISGESASVRGHGSHTDIIMASAYAFVDALNRLAELGRAGDGADDARTVGP